MDERITLDDLKNLTRNDAIIIEGRRWRVNGQVKIWKRDPSRVRVPVKFGLYGYGAITENDLDGILSNATIDYGRRY